MIFSPCKIIEIYIVVQVLDRSIIVDEFLITYIYCVDEKVILREFEYNERIEKTEEATGQRNVKE
jgi:hypothetical protein